MIVDDALLIRGHLVRHRLIGLCNVSGVGEGEIIPDNIWTAAGVSADEIAEIKAIGHALMKRQWTLAISPSVRAILNVAVS